MEFNDVNIEKLMRADLNMRDEIESLEAKIKEINQKRDVVQKALVDACAALNVSGLKSSVGTLTRTLKTRYWTNDWPAMHKFLKENDALDLMEKRLSQSNFKEFLEKNPDTIPPGLQADQEYKVVIRRSKDNKESV